MAGRKVALLRGINVGRAKRIAMADLRALVEKLGYGEVRTLLNSGNVVFAGGTSRRDPAARIEEAIAEQLGVTSRVTVLTAAEIAVAVAENPLLGIASNPSRLFVAVLRGATERARVAPLAKRDWSPERFAVGTRVAYLWCPDGPIDSPLAKAVYAALGDAVTMRNWATTLKLHALTGGADVP